MNQKKESIKETIGEFVETVLDLAEKNENLDYFRIEISNNNGVLQTDYLVKNRKKAY